MYDLKTTKQSAYKQKTGVSSFELATLFESFNTGKKINIKFVVTVIFVKHTVPVLMSVGC